MTPKQEQTVRALEERTGTSVVVDVRELVSIRFEDGGWVFVGWINPDGTIDWDRP